MLPGGLFVCGESKFAVRRSSEDSVGNDRAVYRARPVHRSQLKLETDAVWLRRSGVWIMVTLYVQETLNFLYTCCAFKIEVKPT
jgi:hypothetical protein